MTPKKYDKDTWWLGNIYTHPKYMLARKKISKMKYKKMESRQWTMLHKINMEIVKLRKPKAEG